MCMSSRVLNSSQVNYSKADDTLSEVVHSYERIAFTALKSPGLLAAQPRPQAPKWREKGRGCQLLKRWIFGAIFAETSDRNRWYLATCILESDLSDFFAWEEIAIFVLHQSKSNFQHEIAFETKQTIAKVFMCTWVFKNLNIKSLLGSLNLSTFQIRTIFEWNVKVGS